MLYGDKSYEQEAKYIKDILLAFGLSSGVIGLEFGSGSGKLALELELLDYPVKGVEISEAMIARAETNGFYDTELGDVRTYVPSGVKYDFAIAFFHVMSYLSTYEDLLQAFSSVGSALKKNGIFVFDFWFRDAVVANPPEVRVKKVSDNHHDVTRVAVPQHLLEDSSVLVEYKIYDQVKGSNYIRQFREDHNMRYFGLDEMRGAAARSGFEIILAEEPLTKRSPCSETWGICCVARKIAGE